jgi:hypothetical protein
VKYLFKNVVRMKISQNEKIIFMQKRKHRSFLHVHNPAIKRNRKFFYSGMEKKYLH